MPVLVLRVAAQLAHSPWIGKWLKRAWWPKSAASAARTPSSAAGSTVVTRPQRSQQRYSWSAPRASA